MNNNLSFWLLMLIGSASFFLTGLSYAQKSMLRLRLLAILALVLGLIYSVWTHALMPDGQNLWPTIVALTVFLGQNLWLVSRDVWREFEADVPPSSKRMMVQALPDMHSRDWKEILDGATRTELSEGHVIFEEGHRISHIWLLESGSILLTDARGLSKTAGPGSLLGEVGYLVDDPALHGAPFTARAAGKAVIYGIHYDRLKEISARSDRFEHSLLRGLIRGAAISNGLVSCVDVDSVAQDDLAAAAHHDLPPDASLRKSAGEVAAEGVPSEPPSSEPHERDAKSLPTRASRFPFAVKAA